MFSKLQVALVKFTWDNDACTEHHKEIDIEFSRWGNAQDTTNSQYVIQPYIIPGNLHRWTIPTSLDSSTHSFDWYNDTIDFLSVKGHQSIPPYDSVLQSWTYTGTDVPTIGDEQTRINQWLFNGQAPSDSEEVELVITSFEFFPHIPVSSGEDPNPIVERYWLSLNFPNPFNSSTEIHYSIPQENWVTIKVYNLLGQEVAVLQNKQQSAGAYEVRWQPNNFSSGIYFYQMVSGEWIKTRKLLLLQ